MNPISGAQGAGGADEAGDAQRGNQLIDMFKDILPKLLEGGLDLIKTVLPQLAPFLEIAEKVMQGLGATAEEFAQASKALENPETVAQMNEAMA